MSKLFAIALIVIGIWVGLTVYTQGTGQAFGGLFARFSGSSTLDAPATRSAPHRAADTLQHAYDESEDRVDRALRGTR